MFNYSKFRLLLLILLNDCSDISANEKQSTRNENANNGSNEFAIERSNPNGNESRSDTRARYGYCICHCLFWYIMNIEITIWITINPIFNISLLKSSGRKVTIIGSPARNSGSHRSGKFTSNKKKQTSVRVDEAGNKTKIKVWIFFIIF